MQKTTTTCDNCGKELDHYLDIEIRETDTRQNPPIEHHWLRDVHVCNHVCLRDWAEKENEKKVES